MCLILLAYRVHPDFPLVVAANRDEWFERPTAPVGFWEDVPGLCAGRDLQQGGTWLGVTRAGRFAALTNHRDPSRVLPTAPSRGALVVDFLASGLDAKAYLASLADRAGAYNGFNLFVAHGDSLAYFSNRGRAARVLAPGIYGLSNGLLDDPWPKVVNGKRRLAEALTPEPDPAALLALLDDRREASDDALPATGVSKDWERKLSAMHIVAEDYGTRSSTALIVGRTGETQVVERTFDASGQPTGIVVERFKIGGGEP